MATNFAGESFGPNPIARKQFLGGLSFMTRLLTADEVVERLGVTKDWV